MIDHGGIAEPEMDDARILRGITVARGDDPHHAQVAGAGAEDGADTLAVALSTAQADAQPMAAIGNAIDEVLRRGIVVVDDEVEPAVAIKVGNGHTPAVPQTVQPIGRGGFHKSAVAQVDQQTVALVAVPGEIANELIAEQVTAVVGPVRRDRAGVEFRSKIVRLRTRDPTVGGVDVEPAVVINIKEAG